MNHEDTHNLIVCAVHTIYARWTFLHKILHAFNNNFWIIRMIVI